MASLSGIDRYTSPSSWLKGAQALVDEGMNTVTQRGLIGLTQVSAGFISGFGMQRWGDKAQFFGAPADLVIGFGLVAASALKIGGEKISEFVGAAGLGALTAASARYGADAAVAFARRQAAAQKAA